MTMINARNAGPISHAMACTPTKTTTIAAAPRRTSNPRGSPPGPAGPAPFGDAPEAPFMGVAAELVIRLTLGTARTSGHHPIVGETRRFTAGHCRRSRCATLSRRPDTAERVAPVGWAGRPRRPGPLAAPSTRRTVRREVLRATLRDPTSSTSSPTRRLPLTRRQRLCLQGVQFARLLLRDETDRDQVQRTDEAVADPEPLLLRRPRSAAAPPRGARA